jgi:hypothetical protein
MGWWTQAKIDTFEDRNNVNERILKLEALVDVLRYAAKLVYQTARGARKMVADVADNKSIDSYEEVKMTLAAADKCAIDSPNKFSLFCNHAAKILEGKKTNLEDMRTEFTEEELPKRLKGLADER